MVQSVTDICLLSEQSIFYITLSGSFLFYIVFFLFHRTTISFPFPVWRLFIFSPLFARKASAVTSPRKMIFHFIFFHELEIIVCFYLDFFFSPDGLATDTVFRKVMLPFPFFYFVKFISFLSIDFIFSCSRENLWRLLSIVKLFLVLWLVDNGIKLFHHFSFASDNLTLRKIVERYPTLIK